MKLKKRLVSDSAKAQKKLTSAPRRKKGQFQGGGKGEDAGDFTPECVRLTDLSVIDMYRWY